MGMTFDDAIQAHAQWRLRLIRYLETQGESESLDPALVGADNRCALGQWIHGEEKAIHGALPEFQELVRLHATFHQKAAGVVNLAKAGQYAQGLQAVDADSEFQKASLEVITAIRRLARKV